MPEGKRWRSEPPEPLRRLNSGSSSIPVVLQTVVCVCEVTRAHGDTAGFQATLGC